MYDPELAVRMETMAADCRDETQRLRDNGGDPRLCEIFDLMDTALELIVDKAKECMDSFDESVQEQNRSELMEMIGQFEGAIREMSEQIEGDEEE